MRTAATLAAFFGWGVAAALVGEALPSLSFLLGLAVGAGAMLIDRREL